jgi:hypothetical protein
MGGREQTRTDHLVEVAKFLGWRQVGETELKELDQFLAARALEHDSPTLLFRLACDYLSRRVAAAREVARADLPAGRADARRQPGVAGRVGRPVGGRL